MESNMFPVLRVLSGDELAYHPVQHAAQSFNSSDIKLLIHRLLTLAQDSEHCARCRVTEPKVRRPARPGSCPFLDCGSHPDLCCVHAGEEEVCSPGSTVCWRDHTQSSCVQQRDRNAGYQPYSFQSYPAERQQDGLPPSFNVVQVLRTDDAQAGHRGDGERIGEQFNKSDFFCRVIPER